MNKWFNIIMLAVIIIFIAFFPFKFSGKDILSVNPGGGSQFSVSSTPLTQGGGFFSEISQIPSAPPPQQPSGNVPSGVQGVTPANNIGINVTNINITIINGTYSYQYILIKNKGASSATISVYQTNLTGIALINGSPSFTLASGESKILPVLFLAPQVVGIYSGNLIIAGQTIPVTLNSVTYLLMFDLDAQILNPNLVVFQGDVIRTKIKITPKGNVTPVDVALNYTIKDSSGKIYFSHSEVLLVEKQLTIDRDLKVGILPLGIYTLDVELYYPNGIAPSGNNFEVQKKIILVGQIIYYVITGAVTFAIILVIIIIFVIRSIANINKRKNLH